MARLWRRHDPEQRDPADDSRPGRLHDEWPYWAVIGTTGDFSGGQAGGQFNLSGRNFKGFVVLLEAGKFSVKKELVQDSKTDMLSNDGPLMFTADGARLIGVIGGTIRAWTTKDTKAAGQWGKDLHRVVLSADGRFALGRQGYATPFVYEGFDLQEGRSLGTFTSKIDGEHLGRR